MMMNEIECITIMFNNNNRVALFLKLFFCFLFLTLRIATRNAILMDVIC